MEPESHAKWNKLEEWQMADNSTQAWDVKKQSKWNDNIQGKLTVRLWPQSCWYWGWGTDTILWISDGGILNFGSWWDTKTMYP